MVDQWSEPFLRDPETVDAISEIANANKVVIYCGAGATRDQTGLGWDGMVSAVFEAAKSSRRSDRVMNSRIRSLIANPALPPQQKASIVTQKAKPRGLKESDFLARHLSRVLYDERGWGEGFLLRNIALLAVGLAQLERNVLLVTTNYDDYLLRRIEKLISDAKGHSAPGLRAYCLGFETNPIVESVADGTLPTLEIAFAHGFTPPRGSKNASCGDIVFSERSYLETQSRTRAFLVSMMDSDTTFLTVGASLADPPLIEAIQSGSKNGSKVFTLIDLPGPLNDDKGDDVAAAQTQSLIAERALHLGVRRALTPANFSQVAQFVEEVRVCAYLNADSGKDPARDYRSVGSYAARLRSWWHKWSASAQADSHDDHYILLAVALDMIRDQLESYGCKPSDSELLRLEMWVRLDPSVARDRRNLTLFANSSGPIIDTTARREEPIRRTSGISSVKAFVLGKPILTPLGDLGYPATASRWQTFLSVPLFHEVPVEVRGGGVPVTGSVPLGVVTLSSSLPMGDDVPDRACFADEKLGNAEYKDLLRVMIDVGREIVSGF